MYFDWEWYDFWRSWVHVSSQKVIEQLIFRLRGVQRLTLPTPCVETESSSKNSMENCILLWRGTIFYAVDTLCGAREFIKQQSEKTLFWLGGVQVLSLWRPCVDPTNHRKTSISIERGYNFWRSQHHVSSQKAHPKTTWKIVFCLEGLQFCMLLT